MNINSPPPLQGTQMATPINTLPLKTTQVNTTDLDDPLIQNVLKEFEDDAQIQQQESLPQIHQPKYSIETQSPPQISQVQYIQPNPNIQQQFDTNQYNYNQNNDKNKNIIDIDLIKKATIITIIVFLLQYNNILSYFISKLPESVYSYINGKEFILNIVLLFIIFYALIYFDLI